MAQPNQLTAQNNHFTFNTGVFFKEMREAIASTADGSFGTATNKLIAAFVQKDDSEAALLHQIIWEAAAKACTEITKEKFDVNQRSNIGADAFIRNRDLSREILAIEFTIDKTFFDAPHRHPQVLELRDFFAKWLQLTFEINETDAKNKAGAFPRIFLRELVQSDKDKLIKIKAFFNHPVFEAYEKDFRQEIYHGKLMQEYKCTAFGNEAIPLSELYIKPFFTVFEHLIKDKKERKNREFEQPFHPNDIDKKETGFLKPINNINTHDFFEAWLENTNVLKLENGAGNLMLLFGQPGQGKTSFCSHTMYHLLLSNSDKNIYFYRLRDFEGTPTEFIEKPLDVLRDLFTKQVFNGNKMVDDDWHNSFLILDGLDELLMNKNMSNEQIRQLLSNLKSDIHQLQSYQTEKQLKCLVTSRHHYVPLELYKTDKWLIISLDNLRYHQQKEWIAKYSSFIQNQSTITYLKKLNDILAKLDKDKDKKSQELRNLVNQPILLTLIAQSEVQLDLSTDRANIYGKMFDTLQNRAWETDQIPNLQKLKADEKVQKLYRLFLQRLALHIYHSKNEYVRRSDFDTSGTKLNETFGLLKNRFSATEFNIEQVLSSFYFKQVVKQYDNDTQDENHNYAFEFLHKSLQEYLVAEAIWNYSKLLLNKNEFDDYSKKDSVVFEEFFLDYFSPKIISNEIVEYLIELIQNDKAVAVKEELADRLKKVFTYASKHDFLYKYDSGETYSNPPLTKSINTFYGLWIFKISVINDLVGFNKEKTNIIDDYKPIISDFIILLRRNFPNAYLSLKFQNFSGAVLSGAILSGAVLSGAILSGAILSGTDLRRADLSGADLREANLSQADLSQANLSQAYLRRADLRRADLRRAGLFRADLSGADLSGADLREADLSGADLSGADLSGAVLREADLRQADLRQADLREADLSGADLSGADLREANLSQADLSQANLSQAYLSQADLSGVIGLDKAFNLETANFKGTIFEGKINQRADGSYWIEGYSKGEL